MRKSYLMATDNYKKHTSNNPFKKFFIRNFFNAILRDLGILEIGSVLDVGCGEGFTLKILKGKGIGRVHQGIDYSKKAIEIGKKDNPELKLQVGDIYNLKFKDNSFDLVVSTEVFEHLDEPEKALSEIKRVSRKYILLSVPNEPWFYLSNYTQWGKDIGHINKWSSRGFEKFIKDNNLKILSKKTPFPWTVLLIEK